MEYPNWFEVSAKDNFEYVLKDLAGKPYLKFLQIGAFTGDASVWLFENILTHPTSTLYDVDTWRGSDEDVHKSMDFDDVFNTYLKKTDKYKEQRQHFRMSSDAYLQSEQTPMFDFIYIDGDHTSAGVLSDAVMSFNLLSSGGIMAFDDYTWTADTGLDIDTPKPAINFFYWANQKHLEPVLANSQFWVKKK